MNWGLTSRILGGTYATEEGDPPINNKTPPPAGAQWNHIEPLTATGQAFAKVTIEERIDNTFEASLAGAQVYFGSETPGDTAWISLGGAEMTGIFDPLASTWQAVALTAGIKVPEFMNKVEGMTAAERQAFYEATNIPAFNVGATDLRGSLGGVYLGSATDPAFGIKNVTFFAPTSGAKPQIWASGGTSGGVSGTFTGTPSALTVPLQGFAVGSGSVASPASTNGITASFNVEKWGAAAGQNWGATITNGAAPANALTGATGYTTANVITFEGGATGTIISAPGGAPGTFSGTAAGIVK
jgi:hypothetical protein